jgi:hypothetical protein
MSVLVLNFSSTKLNIKILGNRTKKFFSTEILNIGFI